MRSWPADADLGSSTARLQHRGEKRGAISELGWDDALSGYRPFLSHAELEAFFGRPSELHDLLASVLGLDDLARRYSTHFVKRASYMNNPYVDPVQKPNGEPGHRSRFCCLAAVGWLAADSVLLSCF